MNREASGAKPNSVFPVERRRILRILLTALLLITGAVLTPHREWVRASPGTVHAGQAEERAEQREREEVGTPPSPGSTFIEYRARHAPAFDADLS
jgi:hypothetical protein